MPVGSSQWVQHERDQAADFVGQDVEEFSYSVRNELDWLNERMADIFSKTEVYVRPLKHTEHALTAIVTSPTCSKRLESYAARLLELRARRTSSHRDSL